MVVGVGRLQSGGLPVIMSPVLLSLSLVLLLCPLFGGGSPIMAPERHRLAPGLDDGRGGVVDPSLLEQNSEVDMQKLLDTLKGQFLRTFNLSGLGPRHSQPGTERTEPPEYMMELYNRFANDRTAMPTANIIRSFKDEDSSPCSVGARGVRIHSLLFNVSLPHHERVTAAELRLYTLVQTDRHLYAGVDRKVTVYEVEQRYPGNSSGGDGGGGGGGVVTRGDALDEGPDVGESEERTVLVELASRQVYGMDDGWESFDMTAAVHRWRKSSHSTTHRLEVHIASLDAGADKDGEAEAAEAEVEAEAEGEGEGEGEGEPRGRAVRSDGNMDIETNQEDRHRPLMIIFSDDQSGDHHRGDRRELNEMIGHEAVGAGLQDNLNGLLDELGEMGLAEGGDGDGGDSSEPDEETLMQMHSNLIYDSSSRIRRNAKGNHCKKNSLYVEFKDIGWDSWILAPTGYEAYECTGVCSFPLTPHVKPTKHAMVQTLVNMKSPQKVAPACCVPTKLDPISLLYLDDAGVVTYKYKFEGMVVAECGCR